MKRFCYCSKILPGKSHVIRRHWKDEEGNKSAGEISFWNHLRMTGFESWLRSMPQGDFMIHCLEGESLQQIFKGLQEQIASGNPVALKLYPNNLKNWDLDLVKARGFGNLSPPNIINIEQVKIVKPRELSRKKKTQLTGGMSIGRLECF